MVGSRMERRFDEERWINDEREREREEKRSTGEFNATCKLTFSHANPFVIATKIMHAYTFMWRQQIKKNNAYEHEHMRSDTEHRMQTFPNKTGNTNLLCAAVLHFENENLIRLFVSFFFPNEILVQSRRCLSDVAASIFTWLKILFRLLRNVRHMFCSHIYMFGTIALRNER